MIEIKTTYNLLQYCKNLVDLSKKDGLLFSGKIFFFIVFKDSEPIAFFGLKLSDKSATMKCSYVSKEHRKKGLLNIMTKARLNWIKDNRPKINKVHANVTKMSLNTHKRLGANVVKIYKNNITKLQYEIL